MVARRAHNPKVVGSNPAPATNLQKKALENSCFNDYFPRFFFVIWLLVLIWRSIYIDVIVH